MKPAEQQAIDAIEAAITNAALDADLDVPEQQWCAFLEAMPRRLRGSGLVLQPPRREQYREPLPSAGEGLGIRGGWRATDAEIKRGRLGPREAAE